MFIGGPRLKIFRICLARGRRGNKPSFHPIMVGSPIAHLKSTPCAPWSSAGSLRDSGTRTARARAREADDEWRPAELNTSEFTLANLAPGLERPRSLPTHVRTGRLPASLVTLYVQGFPPGRIPSSATKWERKDKGKKTEWLTVHRLHSE